MVKTHTIKLSHEFQEAVLSGDKTFEVRRNDRGYQKGDLVQFRVVDNAGIEMLRAPLSEVTFVITYVLSGWHIEQDYVVFGIRRV